MQGSIKKDELFFSSDKSINLVKYLCIQQTMNFCE